MPSTTDPSIWSSIGINRPRRRSSAALPKRESDVHDKYMSRRHHKTSLQERIRAAWMNQNQRARYIKAGCLVTFVLLVLYYITPASYTPSLPNAGSSLRGGDVASLDPAMQTAKCTKSYAKDKPLIQYALMIDAGSTGSRIHVYRFNNCGPTPELENEDFAMTAKRDGGSGLSSYKSDAEGAAMSLDPLMEVAMKNVPDKLKSCTPIAVKATAGLRKLGPDMSDAILKAVRHRLETAYPFPVLS